MSELLLRHLPESMKFAPSRMVMNAMNSWTRTAQYDRRDRLGRVRLLERIRSEFDEMPGLRLTRDQAMRLWSLPEDTCDRIFQELEREGFLRRLNNGAYGKPDLGA